MLTATTTDPNTVNAAALAFIDEILSWQESTANLNEAAALLGEIAELVPNLVVNVQTGADLFDEAELRGLGNCDRTLNNPVRYPHEPSYLEGYLKRSKLLAE